MVFVHSVCINTEPLWLINSNSLSLSKVDPPLLKISKQPIPWVPLPHLDNLFLHSYFPSIYVALFSKWLGKVKWEKVILSKSKWPRILRPKVKVMKSELSKVRDLPKYSKWNQGFSWWTLKWIRPWSDIVRHTFDNYMMTTDIYQHHFWHCAILINMTFMLSCDSLPMNQPPTNLWLMNNINVKLKWKIGRLDKGVTILDISPTFVFTESRCEHLHILWASCSWKGSDPRLY